ncbi:hypothetical protein FSF52_024175, partial [Escherichia coli]|uniref:head-tail joining protein n=1 Tax=Escherichia coli TaxID=562 RepID=UPI001BFE55B9
CGENITFHQVAKFSVPLQRGDTLTIGEENFWVDRISPDDGGSCHLWLGRGVPPAVNRRR